MRNQLLAERGAATGGPKPVRAAAPGALPVRSSAEGGGSGCVGCLVLGRLGAGAEAGMEIARAQAQRLHRRAGLLDLPASTVSDALAHHGYIQIDPINGAGGCTN